MVTSSCIPRIQMPQVDLEHIETLYAFLQRNNVPHYRAPVPLGFIQKRQCADEFVPSLFTLQTIPPLILSKELLIVDGNHRYEVLKRQGLLTADAIVMGSPFDVCRTLLLGMPGVYRTDTIGRRIDDAA